MAPKRHHGKVLLVTGPYGFGKTALLCKFYEQLALAYGVGLRMNFTYFLVRLDMGMKAHDPASGQEHWPMFSPNFKRDSEFHFSVGYPF